MFLVHKSENLDIGPGELLSLKYLELPHLVFLTIGITSWGDSWKSMETS